MIFCVALKSHKGWLRVSKW